MKWIPRTLQPMIERALFQGKAVIIYGARRVGKTTLVKEIVHSVSGQSRYLNCDEPDVRLALTGKTSTELRRLLGRDRLAVIDEAQRVRDIGITLKLIVDNLPDIQVVATGSSSFDLSNRIKEPLTGRKVEFHLFPFSIEELLPVPDQIEFERQLEAYLRFGLYPEIVFRDQPEALICEIASSYLYRDVLEYQPVRAPELFQRLLQALALQTGSEVSFNELSTLLGLDRTTVLRYVSLLEHAQILYRLPVFSRNPRKELGKRQKIGFWDLGVRNAIIQYFHPLALRSDVGALWENFFTSERMKYLHNHGRRFSPHFWRTYQGAELDYLEETAEGLTGFECKWRSLKWRPPTSFLQNYAGSALHLVTPLSFLPWVTGI
ncbi:MAG: ATP-binding protein [Coprothermobacterota bacterium]|nr:ATP-binding protein [Coprothermobacterota bacterium]